MRDERPVFNAEKTYRTIKILIHHLWNVTSDSNDAARRSRRCICIWPLVLRNLFIVPPIKKQSTLCGNDVHNKFSVKIFCLKQIGFESIRQRDLATYVVEHSHDALRSV